MDYVVGQQMNPQLLLVHARVVSGSAHPAHVV
jgi:hypothetical protein